MPQSPNTDHWKADVRDGHLGIPNPEGFGS